jgi:hypothetical protein
MERSSGNASKSVWEQDRSGSNPDSLGSNTLLKYLILRSRQQ